MYFMLRLVVLTLLFLDVAFIPSFAGNDISFPNEDNQGSALSRVPTAPRNLFNSPNYTPEQQELANQFMQEFTRMFTAALSPHCRPEDRLHINTSIPRRVDKFIERAFKNKPDLKLYAERLPQFITNHYQSKQAELTSIQDLIDKELRGNLSPAHGYAIDFFPADSSLRNRSLLNVFMLNKTFLQIYGLEETLSRNLVWDFLKLDAFNMCFKRGIEKFQSINALCKEEFRKLLRLSASSLHDDTSVKSAKLTFSWILQDIETETHIIKLFLPIANLLLEDSQITRELKKDKETGGDKVLQELRTSRQSLRDLLGQIHFYREHFNRMLTPRPEEQPETTILTKPISAPKKQKVIEGEKEEEMISTSEAAPVEIADKSENIHIAENVIIESTQQPQTKEEKNYLEEWVTHTWETPAQTNLKCFYSQPSEQDIKEERKRQAKEKKETSGSARSC